jgi:hypothetical protein
MVAILGVGLVESHVFNQLMHAVQQVQDLERQRQTNRMPVSGRSRGPAIDPFQS